MPNTLLADFHVLGMLSGVAVARIALNPDPEVVADLRRKLDELRSSPPTPTPAMRSSARRSAGP